MTDHRLPPIVRLADDVVMLTGPGVDALRWCVQVTIRARHRNGLPESGDLKQLLAAATPLSTDGHTDSATEPADHDGTQTDWVTTGEAAELLGCSKRSVTRIAPLLGAVRRGRIWLYDRQDLTEHLAERKQHGTKQA